MGVPCKLGGGGMEGIIELDLNKQEKAAMKTSLSSVKELVKQVDDMGVF